MKARRVLLMVLMAGVAGACGTPSDESAAPSGTATAILPGPSETASSPSPSPASAAPSASGPGTLSPRPIADDPPRLALDEVARVEQPVNIATNGDGWLYVNERRGRVVAIAPATGMTSVVLDITDRVGSGSSEQGLLGLAFHPSFQGANLRAFVHYTDRKGDTVVSEFLVSDLPRPSPLDPATERVLLRVDQPFANHNGGQLAFGPDGHLYVGLGDGGGGGDPFGNGQDPGSLLGSILRLDVDADPEDAEYAIPDDNPFVDGGGAPEVFLYGLRNPWRLSFDRLTGAMWIADVGQNAFEEINRVDPAADAGGNLGWNVMEASHCFVDADCDPGAFIGPVSEYGRESGCSVTGGHVYRGNAIGDLAGWYLFGDYCSGVVFGIRSDVDRLTAPRPLLETGRSISTFGEDDDGELYLADLDGGAIYRIVGAD